MYIEAVQACYYCAVSEAAGAREVIIKIRNATQVLRKMFTNRRSNRTSTCATKNKCSQGSNKQLTAPLNSFTVLSQGVMDFRCRLVR